MSARNQAKSRAGDSTTGDEREQSAAGVDSKSGGFLADSPIVRKAIGKGDARYWMQAGKLDTDKRSRFYSCRIQVQGRREPFPLRTANRSEAASRAARIFSDVVALGWEQALAKHKPQSAKSTKCATVGELLAEVKATVRLRDSTFTAYSQALRQIVAEIAEIGDQPALDESGSPKHDRRGRIIYRSRRDRYGGGRAAWVAKVECQSLDLLTPDAVQRWRLAYLAKAGSAPDAMRRASTSVSTLLRCARSLFSLKTLEFAQKKLNLPEPLPFAGVKMEKRPTTRYMSKLDAPSIIAKARSELSGDPFKIFVLGLFAGLRKREIDTLLWRQVDFVAGQIRIEATEYFQPKSEDAINTVDLDGETLAVLRGWKAQARGQFVVAPNAKPQTLRSRSNYRCTSHFQVLYKWLRAQGITALKPLHELRKELGAILASEQGIYAAQSVLRHAHISTTAAFYADKKRRITAGLGSLLGESTADNVTPFAPAAKTQTSRRAAR